MTSEGETLLWSSYMFFANSMSTATCQQEKMILFFFKREDNLTLETMIQIQTDLATKNLNKTPVCDKYV